MKIEVLGPGCAKCDGLMELVNQVVSSMNIEADIEHVTDMNKILEYGVMMTPALLINGFKKCVGRVPSPGEIKTWILEAQA